MYQILNISLTTKYVLWLTKTHFFEVYILSGTLTDSDNQLFTLERRIGGRIKKKKISRSQSSVSTYLKHLLPGDEPLNMSESFVIH